MYRRDFLRVFRLRPFWLHPQSAHCWTPLAWGRRQGAAPLVDAATAKDWLARWEKFTIDSARERACDKETGEGIGWLLSPRLTGFYYGYMATRDQKWVEMLVDWTDSWIRARAERAGRFYRLAQAG